MVKPFVVFFSGASYVGGGEISLLSLGELMKDDWDITLICTDPELAEAWEKRISDNVLLSSLPSLKKKLSHVGKFFKEGLKVKSFLWNSLKNSSTSVLYFVNTPYSVPIILLFQRFFLYARVISAVRTEINESDLLRDKYKFSKVDGLLFSSNFLKKKVEPYIPCRVAQSVIYPFIDTGEIQYSQRNFDSPLRVGVVGSISPLKGQDFVLKLAKLCPEYVFFIIGHPLDYHFWSELKSYCSRFKLKNVVWIDWLDDKNEIYNKIDVLLVPSFVEGFGRVIPEAFCSGALVLTNNNVGMCELINNGVEAFLLDRLDVYSWKEKLKWIRDCPEKAKEMTKKAREKASILFNPIRIKAHWKEYVESVLQNR